MVYLTVQNNLVQEIKFNNNKKSNKFNPIIMD